MKNAHSSSIDIAKGYKTTVFDLNTEQAPQHWKDNFDLVLNFGTTEHVFNQSNAFNTIHNMTKKNAFIMHQPFLGMRIMDTLSIQQDFCGHGISQ